MNSKEVKDDLQNLIKITELLVAKLTVLIERVEKHIRDCFIARTTGVSVAAVGTSMVVGGWLAGLILAVPTFGFSLTVPAVMTVAGTGTAIAGSLTAAGTEIADGIISKQFFDQLTAIQRSHAVSAQKAEKTLNQIQQYVAERKDDCGINAQSTGNVDHVKIVGAAVAFGASGVIDDVFIAALRGLGIGTSSVIIKGALRGCAVGVGVVFAVIDIVQLVKDYADPNPLLKELERVKQLYLKDIDVCETLILSVK